MRSCPDTDIDPFNSEVTKVPLPSPTQHQLHKFGGGLISFCYAGLYYILTIVKTTDLRMADQIY